MVMGLTATTAAAPAAQLVDNDEVVIVLRDGVDPVKAAQQMGIKPTYIYRSVFSGFAGKLPAASVATANRSSLVDLISPNTPVEATRQPVPTGVRRIVAHDARPIPGKKAQKVGVAVLDSGIQAQQAPPKRKKRPNFRARDLNVQGGTSCIGKGSPLVDRNGHGTHVAGTIGARNNNYGTVGVAPGVALYAVRVLDNRGIGSMASVICGLDWVAKRPGRIDVVNLSLGGRGGASTCASNALHRAICRVVNQKGISVVVAAGNDSEPAANFIPANFPEVVTVSAYADTNGVPNGGGPGCGGQVDDTYASFSNYGPEVDIAAPGVCIRSTSTRGGTRVMTGTSMAAPHVSGALALYYAQHPRTSQAQARDWLLNVAAVQPDDPGGLVDNDNPRWPSRVLWLQGIRP